MSWAKGSDTVEQLLNVGHLERVLADPAEAQYLLSKAQVHLETADSLADDDPEIAYAALYSAARKALTAVLRQQGLRPTTKGGHEVVIQAAEAQLIPPLEQILRPFRQLKRTRGAGEYSALQGALTGDDVRADLPAARAIVEAARKVVPTMPVFNPAR